jgi:hypothetical protein
VGAFKRLAVRKIGNQRFKNVAEGKVTASGPKAAKVA